MLKPDIVTPYAFNTSLVASRASRLTVVTYGGMSSATHSFRDHHHGNIGLLTLEMPQSTVLAIQAVSTQRRNNDPLAPEKRSYQPVLVLGAAAPASETAAITSLAKAGDTECERAMACEGGPNVLGHRKCMPARRSLAGRTRALSRPMPAGYSRLSRMRYFWPTGSERLMELRLVSFPALGVVESRVCVSIGPRRASPNLSSARAMLLEARCEPCVTLDT